MKAKLQWDELPEFTEIAAEVLAQYPHTRAHIDVADIIAFASIQETPVVCQATAETEFTGLVGAKRYVIRISKQHWQNSDQDQKRSLVLSVLERIGRDGLVRGRRRYW